MSFRDDPAGRLKLVSAQVEQRHPLWSGDIPKLNAAANTVVGTTADGTSHTFHYMVDRIEDTAEEIDRDGVNAAEVTIDQMIAGQDTR